MRLWIPVGFHSSLIPDNSREAATAKLPWAPQIFRARVTGFGQVFMSTDWRIKLYCTVLYGTVLYSPSSLPNDPADKTLFSEDEQLKCFPIIMTSHEDHFGANVTNLR